MSFDAKIYRVCDHKITNELYKIDPRDLTTLKYSGDSNIYMSVDVIDEFHSFGENPIIGSNSSFLAYNARTSVISGLSSAIRICCIRIPPSLTYKTDV